MGHPSRWVCILIQCHAKELHVLMPTQAGCCCKVAADVLCHAAGGLVADGVFMRTVVSYGSSGRLASIAHEQFDRVA